jgi:hypothetical protein
MHSLKLLVSVQSHARQNVMTTVETLQLEFSYHKTNIRTLQQRYKLIRMKSNLFSVAVALYTRYIPI